MEQGSGRRELEHSALMLETDQCFGVDFVPRYGRGQSAEGSELQEVAEELDTSAFEQAKASATATGMIEDKPEGGVRAGKIEMLRAGKAEGGSKEDKAALLEAIHKEHDAECPHCTSTKDYTQTVFGEGNADARLMFVGEAPGEEEDRTGRPFVGRAGQKLNDIISAMGLKREDVYIANILKARPPGNRTPLTQEVERCAPYLVKQIRTIRPDVIVTLGGPATKFLLQTDRGITTLRGIWAQYADEDLIIPVMPTFHPAYLLRAYTVENRQKVWSDMQAVLDKLKEAEAD